MIAAKCERCQMIGTCLCKFPEFIEEILINKEEKNIENLKETVHAVIINEKGEFLCVSRKDDHTNFGLPGGKVDPEDFDTDENYYNCLENAIKREVKEETGLEIYDLKLVFAMGKYDYMGYTYYAKYSGEINYDEPHKVKWGTSKDLLDGCFGKYNRLVLDSLNNFKIKYL